MSDEHPYRVPLERLEQVRVARTEQVVLHGDGMGPPPVLDLGPGHPGGGGAADTDGD